MGPSFSEMKNVKGHGHVRVKKFVAGVNFLVEHTFCSYITFIYIYYPGGKLLIADNLHGIIYPEQNTRGNLP